MSDEDPVLLDDWRKDGRCGACQHFRVDFGEPPELYGNCKMYRGTGARQSTDYACDQYKPLPGFAALTQSTSIEANLGKAPPPEERRPQLLGSRPRRRAISAPVVRRRREPSEGEAARAVSAVEAFDGFGGAGDDDDDRPGAPTMDRDALRDLIIDVVENFIGIEDVELAQKWAGGTILLQPGDPSLKPHEIPVDTLFHKVVMIRDRLRVLEQKLNATQALTPTEKADLQQYISRCYGSLTTLNVLFKNKEDRFSSK